MFALLAAYPPVVTSPSPGVHSGGTAFTGVGGFVINLAVVGVILLSAAVVTYLATRRLRG